MNFLRTVIFTVTILFSFSLAHAGDLTQEQWIDYMTVNLPKVYCKSDQNYRVCYDVTQEECADTVSSTAQDCTDKKTDELPFVFTFKESRHWGSIIEKCIEAVYDETFAEQRIDGENCGDIRTRNNIIKENFQ